ncbi:MAG: alpha-ketoglutarate-dependent dioxygenase AlkB [Chthonomonadaceae bacterium]|nr:alpha-ketoglutarate-dependent dioxygenase AlkB [Chthonomonadaceae bacterium]
MPDAMVRVYPDFCTAAERARWFDALLQEIAWRDDPIRLFGREIPQPRRFAWYGEEGVRYTYSGLTLYALPWTPVLVEIKHAVESVTACEFNSVLINLYRDGRDSMSWHADDEPELGPCPTIASVSLGGTRRFALRHRLNRQLRTHVDLTDGCLLVMSGSTQHFWHHQIAKTARPVAPRINLTFRYIHA